MFAKRNIYKICGILILCGSFFCIWVYVDVGEKKEAAHKPEFHTQAVTRGKVEEYVSGIGTLNPHEVVLIGSRLSGTVKKIHTDFNRTVSAGQLLLELDPAIYRAELKRAKANLAVAGASLDIAKSNYNRKEKLFYKKFISSSEYEEEKQKRVAADAQYELALADVDKAQTDIDNTLIRSPIDGVILKREVEQGQTIASVFQTPILFHIAQDFKSMRLDTEVSEMDIAKVREGMEAYFLVDAYDSRQFKGVVKQLRLQPNSNNGVVTYNVIIDVDNPERLLLPGMTANVRILTGKVNNVLRIPTKAIYFVPVEEPAAHFLQEPDVDVSDNEDVSEIKNSKNIHKVFRLDTDGGLLPVKVIAGVSNRHYTQILESDLKENDLLVVQQIQEKN